MKQIKLQKRTLEGQIAYWRELWMREYMARKRCREIMSWVAARMETWEKLLMNEYDVATCRELRHALVDNPKLKVQP